MKKNKIISIRITEEDELKIERVAKYFNRSIGETTRLALMDKIELLFEFVLVQESKGTIKQPIFRTMED